MPYISKNNFIHQFDIKDEGIISNIYDKLIIAEKTQNIVYCDYFYTPDIWRDMQELMRSFERNVYTYGFFPEAERRIIVFSNYYVNEFPVKILKVSNGSKFKELEHKDYMGAIMSLGIKREKIGDLVCLDRSCIAPVYEDIYKYIIDNLISVGNCPCNIDVLDNNNFTIPMNLFKESIINCSSLRIDCVVSSICNITRSSAESLIKQSKVLLDYRIINKKDAVVKIGSVITVRGKGKYKVVDDIGFSGSGKTKLKVNKFI